MLFMTFQVHTRMQQRGGADQLLMLLPVLHLYHASKDNFGSSLTKQQSMHGFQHE